ncbi:MAG: hypothetical protein COB02_07210 [Candidatus Cloacimonadota bacterium]|nr:MAG: hypothetical protein COB02_07210 [Candidatus Cloacimonadota bacterium]
MSINQWKYNLIKVLNSLDSNDSQLVKTINALDSSDPLTIFLNGYLINHCPSFIANVKNKTQVSADYFLKSGREGFYLGDLLFLDNFLLEQSFNPGIYEASSSRLYHSKHPSGLFYEGLTQEKCELLKDLESSYLYYLRGAYNKCPMSYFRLGWFYAKGITVKEDQLKAGQYFYVAAVLGNKNACLNFGNRLDEGNTVLQNKKLAKLFWYKGAFLGCEHSRNKYAIACSNEEYGEISLKEAYLNFQKSAYSFDVRSLCNLSRCLFFGNGVKQDKIKAYVYSLFAKNLNDYEGIQMSEKISTELSQIDKDQANEQMKPFFVSASNYQEKNALIRLTSYLQDALKFYQERVEYIEINDMPKNLESLDFIHPELLAEYPI